MQDSSSSANNLHGATPLQARYYARIIRRRKWWIALVFVLAVGGVSGWLARQPRLFEGRTSVIIDVSAPRFLDNQVSDVTDNTSTNYWLNREYYETQNQVITSRAVAQRVVDKLGLQKDPSFLGVSNIRDKAEQERRMATMDAPARLMSMIKVTPVKDSRLVQIVVTDRDGTRAAQLANEIADAYIQENLSLKLKFTETATQWLDERREALEEKSKHSELAIYEFKKSRDMLTTSLEDRASMVSQRLVALNGALTEVRVKVANAKATVEMIRSVKALAEKGDARWAESLPKAIDNDLVRELKVRLAAQKTECAEFQDRYLDDHPKMVACKEKLQSIERDLARELDNIVASSEAELKEASNREKNLVELLEQTKTDAFEVNKRQIEFDQLKREADNDQRLYDLVLKRLKDIELSGLLRTSNVRVLDPARPSAVPVSPNVEGGLLIAIFVGLLGGFGLALFLEVLDTTVTSQTDIETTIGVPFLGLVPRIEGEERKTAALKRDLYIFEHPKSTIAECCRAIRTNLLFMSPEKPFRTMLVTSSGPQEGKSTTVINLGITVAQSGNRVLLIDTDMRRPRLHKAFGVPNDAGVSSVIVGETTLDQSIKSTDVPNVFVMPCGPIPPNPAELLHTNAFADLLKQVSEKFDRVILDSPPIGPVADAAVLSTQVDGVVVVIKGGATNREIAKRAVRALVDVKARLFGAVLNNVDLQDSKYGEYYYSYRQYGYYYGEKKEEGAS